ncbi:MAG: hypothetical protein ACKVRP_00935 [Bacteroidota bacterium]
MPETVLEKTIRYMVQNAVDGVFSGTPRKYMEKIGGSGGGYYNKMKDMGIEQVGKGNKAKWHIPLALMKQFGKK